MNYFEIGQKIRRYRKARGISQEELAERIGISVTHMSHIETGNTKLSLPVFIGIAKALEIRADDLIEAEADQKERAPLAQELEWLVRDCSDAELRILFEIAGAAKAALRKHI